MIIYRGIANNLKCVWGNSQNLASVLFECYFYLKLHISCKFHSNIKLAVTSLSKAASSSVWCASFRFQAHRTQLFSAASGFSALESALRVAPSASQPLAPAYLVPSPIVSESGTRCPKDV